MAPATVLLPFLLLITCMHLLVSATTSPADKKAACHTPDCLALGATLYQNMNPSVDPCTNFYEFACGGFGRRFRYDIYDPSGKPYTDASVHMTLEMENRMYEVLIDGREVTPENATAVRAAAELARAAFNNCVNWGDLKFSDNQSAAADSVVRGVAASNLDALLDSLLPGGRPPKSLEQLLARTCAMGFSTVFGLSVPEELLGQLSADARLSANATRILVTVNAFNYTADASLWQPMLRFLASSNSSLADVVFGGIMAPALESRMAAMAADVGAILASLIGSNVTFHGTIDELDFELGKDSPLPPFSWSLFFQELLPVSEHVDGSTTVAIDNFPLLKALLDYFKSNPVDTKTCRPKDPCRQRLTERHAFLVLDAMLELVDLLPLSLKDLRPAKDSPLAAILALRPRSHRRHCLEATYRLMEPITEWLYRWHFFPGSFDPVERVINETKEATIAGMMEQSWISAEDKNKMMDKVRAMRHYVGYRQLDQEALAAFYASTAAQFNGTRAPHLGHVLNLALRSHARRHLDVFTLAAAPSPFLWESPFNVNAYYDPESNSLLFPLGILAPPVFSPDYPDFALYAGLAALVGHEIGHGFADQWLGVAGGAVGLLQLEPDSEAAYMRLADCVRREFVAMATTTPPPPTTSTTTTVLRSETPALDPQDPPDCSQPPCDNGSISATGNKVQQQQQQQQQKQQQPFGGNSTLADDIADVVGLAAAHRAYMRRVAAKAPLPMTPPPDCLATALLLTCPSTAKTGSDVACGSLEQRLFFVHSAQVYCTKASSAGLEELMRREEASAGGGTGAHSLGPARVNGPLRSSPEFARAFGCPAGSWMNPTQKCVFW